MYENLEELDQMNWSTRGNVLNQYLRNTSIGTTVKHENCIIFTFFYIQEMTDTRPNHCHSTFIFCLDLYIFTCFIKYIVHQKNSLALIAKWISFDFHHLATLFSSGIIAFPTMLALLEDAILDAKLESVSPTLSSWLCPEAYA